MGRNYILGDLLYFDIRFLTQVLPFRFKISSAPWKSLLSQDGNPVYNRKGGNPVYYSLPVPVLGSSNRFNASLTARFNIFLVS
jgi:hypothetical protein